jgi:hypothetical protein
VSNIDSADALSSANLVEFPASNSHATESAITSTWTTCPEAEFFNSLCPVSSPRMWVFGADIPDVRQTDRETAILEEIFADAFSCLRHRWQRYDFDAPAKLTRYEQIVWKMVYRRTLFYGKLLEKIPRRFFIKGVLRQDDDDRVEDKFDEYTQDVSEYKLDRFGFAVLPNAGLDTGDLSKGINGLLEKRWISRFESLPHASFGTSRIYAPLPMNECVHDLLRTVNPEIHKRLGIVWQKAVQTEIERNLDKLMKRALLGPGELKRGGLKRGAP